MFHASTASTFANVENKHVAFERRSLHKLQFVLADAPQILFDLFFAPVITVNHNPNLRFDSTQRKHFELPCLDGRVDESVVALGITAEHSSPAHRLHQLNYRTGC